MKNYFLTLILFCLFPVFAWTQDKFKYGDVSIEELNMQFCEYDSTASAAVLYEKCEVYYNINNSTEDFEIVNEYVVRIKIFNNEGVEYADVGIPYFEESSRALSENITGLGGFTYNLENGKIQKTKLSKEYIFKEDITENQKIMKFAMPVVKPGSVIEYRYKLSSPYYYHPKDYYFQREIPVLYSYFSIRIPEYFFFNKEMKGFQHLDLKEKKINETYLFKTASLNCSAEEITIEARKLPGLKKDYYIWNEQDFMSGISFEIKRVEIPGYFHKDFTQTWASIAKYLLQSDAFGKQMNHKDILKNELSVIIDSEQDTINKIRKILDLVREKIKWNEKATLYVDNPKKSLKEGIGSSGDINAVLISVLRNAGFNANPVVMSLRSRGRIPMTYPSITNLNYFIVEVDLNDKKIYMDATTPYTDINVIPVDCLVDRAICIYQDSYESKNLTNISQNMTFTMISAEFNQNGYLKGNCSQIIGGEYAFLFQNNLKEYNEENEYISKKEEVNDFRISDYKIDTRRENTYSFIESYNFEMKNNSNMNNDIISFNPLVFMNMESNPFQQEARNLPVEFLFPYETVINVTILIPDGYKLDEIPESVKYVYEDDLAQFSYSIKSIANSVQLRYRFNLNTCIISSDKYEYLREFWSKVYVKNNEYVVLKKIIEENE